MTSDNYLTFRRLSLLESKVSKLSEIVSKICEVNIDNPKLQKFCEEYINYYTFQKRSDEIFKDKVSHTGKMYEKLKKKGNQPK